MFLFFLRNEDVSVLGGGHQVLKSGHHSVSKVRRRNRSPAVSHLQRGARRWVRTHSPFTVGLILFRSSFIHISFSTPLASFPAERHISQNIYQLCLKKYVLVLLLWISLVLVFFSLSSSLPRVLLGVICAQELRSSAPPVIIHMLRVCACACVCVFITTN